MAINKSYNDQVFINCPFDAEYRNLYRACIFTVIDAGFIPRCSREFHNANISRLDNIVQLIKECRYGIHDISRVELDNENELPRFNMPFEYGIFYGSQRFGNGNHKNKCALVLEKDKYRYQKFLSDISGIDVTEHNNDVKLLITSIRNWLHTSSRRSTIPSEVDINNRFHLFQNHIRDLCIKNNKNYEDFSYLELVENMTDWLRASQGET